MSPSARRGSACSHMRRFEQLRFVPRIHTSTVIRNGSDLTAYHYVRTGKCKGHLGIHISAHWSLCLYPIMWVLFYVQENSSQGVKATEDLIHTLSTGFRVTPISTFFFGTVHSAGIVTHCVWTFGWFALYVSESGCVRLMLYPQKVVIG